ncbi:hypothetical protein JAO73_20445 [Hymenobacter sp. BT523]|uniref:hypothetical protein n=1 Tax=Hymenobacter sp. BT523 TaxID=2795725 RepID=UPI0018EBAD2B|nr:hypothetical protein [Hymenobacter sp. BT523]MBJ6111402.1 hypothetical protein [Hymenobacter sp. BT523]
MAFNSTFFLGLFGLLLGTGLPGHAQLGFSKGTCTLANGEQLNGSFQLRLATVQSPAILVYYDGKQEQELEPAAVKRCTLGRRSYVVGGNFVAPDEKGGVPVDRDFVEVVDTAGRVQVFRYEYEGFLGGSRGGYIVPAAAFAAGLGMAGGPMFVPMGSGPGYKKTYILLLRSGAGQPLVPYSPGPRKGLFTPAEEKFILPAVGATTAFFPDDAELQKRIETGKVTQLQLPAAVHAYNTGVRLPAKK